MRRFAIALLALTPVAFSAAPAQAALRFFATGDFYLHSNIDDDVQSANDQAIAAAPAGAASSEVTTTNGVGGRAGLRVPLADNRFDLGASFSYVKGPSIDSKFSSAAGDLNSNSDTTFTRLMAEAGFKIPFSDRVALRIGGAAGMGRSTVNTDSDGTGLLAVHKSSDESKDGFTWEVSPALVFTGQRMDVELGLRYAEFPTIDRSDGTPRIEWKPLGAYLGVAF